MYYITRVYFGQVQYYLGNLQWSTEPIDKINGRFSLRVYCNSALAWHVADTQENASVHALRVYP